LATSGGKTIFEGTTSRHARLEVFQPEHLLKMVKAEELP